jgi:uncharacterized repeat protein (TIGR01451 family)
VISKTFRRACGLGIVVGGLAIVCLPAAASSAARLAPRPNLAVHLSATPRPAQIGQNLTYTATVRNFGAAANAVSFRDTIPLRSTFVSATASQGSCTGTRPVLCSLGTLAHGAKATVTIVVKPTANGTIVDNASVRSDRRDRRPRNNHASIAVRVGTFANLGVALAAAPRPGAVGQNLTYTATVRNAGGSDATNVKLTDTIPARSTFVSATASQGSCTGTRPLVCSLGALAKGATAKVTIVVKPTSAGNLVDTARVKSDQADPYRANNARRVVVRVVGPNGNANLGVGLSASPRPGQVGSDLTYTVRVRNLGGSDATNVQLTARVPARSTLVSATASQGSCTGSAPIVCSLGGLAKGATATVTLVVQPTAAGRLVATAHVKSDQRDPRTWNNAARLVTRVRPS